MVPTTSQISIETEGCLYIVLDSKRIFNADESGCYICTKAAKIKDSLYSTIYMKLKQIMEKKS